MKVKFKNITAIPLLIFFACTPMKFHDRSFKTQTGLTVFLKTEAINYTDKKALLLTNHSGLDSNLQRNITLLRNKNIILNTVIAPEHGIYGYEENLSRRSKLYDEKLKLMIYNMHNMSDKQLKSIFKQHDFIIFDIQDMGMRCYTYISNLKTVIDTISEMDMELIILDRPNPIAPFGLDGFNLSKKYETSLISEFPSPLIYGLTIAEAGFYYKQKYCPDANIKIIKMQNYSKHMIFSDTDLPWIPPSPNLPTYKSAVIYTAIVLLEGCNLSLGRGTAKPFEYIGAPWIDPVIFSNALSKIKFKNFHFRPIYFKPTFSHYKNQKCGGVHIVYDGGFFRPSEVTYHILSTLKELYPNRLKWFKWSRYYRIDQLSGTDIFRKSIDQRIPYSDVKKIMIESIKDFEKESRKYLLY